MPHPTILEGYEKTIPGAAERILVMAESSMKHKHQYDSALLKASEDQIKRGQVLGFLIGLATISASVYFATIGYPVLAGIVAGSTLIGLVSVFVIGRITESKE
ncbi:Predicted membrane protein [Nitrosomonas sp. Nm132]|nr:Predicted membrane protein [Nitrosomonas sp. Nm132]